MEGEPHIQQWTPELFSYIEHNTIFAQGIFLDDYLGYPIQETGNVVKWVAVKGDVEDWAIYYQPPYLGQLVWDFQQVAEQGDKPHHPVWIGKLVPCDNAMRGLYRQ